MNAFSSSLRTILFSLLFATLLVFAAGTTTSEIEDGVEQEQKPALSADEYIQPEFTDDSNVFWPPVHLRGLRSSNGKPTFIRFGKRASPSFIRFGRK